MRFRRFALGLGAIQYLSGGAAFAVEAPLNALQQVPAYLAHCWVSPSMKPGTPDARITVLMSFKRNGELLGKPRVTFQSEGPEDDQLAVREAAALALMRCTPLPITDALGGAIAGRTFRMTFEIQHGQRT